MYKKIAQDHATFNRDEILSSSMAGCYFCGQSFPSKSVTVFVDDDRTAVCPRCNNDTVLGDASGYPVTESWFLRAMFDEHYKLPKDVTGQRWNNVRIKMGSLFAFGLKK